MKCRACNKELTGNREPCNYTHIEINTGRHQQDFRRRLVYSGELQHCPDCGAPRETTHHAPCQHEECACCGEQMISCDCVKDFWKSGA